MGTLAAIAPILGLVAGFIVARLARSEIKPGMPYFQLLQHALLAAIAGTLSWNFKTEAIILGILAFTIMWKTKFSHPVELIPLLAVPAGLVPAAQIAIFLYLIPTATLHARQIKKLILPAAVYIIIAAAGI